MDTKTRFCSQCGQANAVNFQFCQNCGSPLGSSIQVQPGAQQPSAPTATGVSPPVATATRPAQPAPIQPSIGQAGSGGLSVADIWGPFAGYGERGRHVSWLLDNLGERAEMLRDAVTARFTERQIPGARIEHKVLTGRGLAVERRPYYLARRGITTAGLYIARFGQDLYISQVTYAKGPINVLRAVIFALMILFQLYLVFGYANSLESAATSALDSFDLFGGYSGGSGGLGTLLCCVGPLGIVNTLLLAMAGLHMFYKFITEKEPLALLRTPPNEFQLDDIVALEKAVEETVRQSLDMVGIDLALMPPAAEYGFRKRLI